jgi:hypothetical protein
MAVLMIHQLDADERRRMLAESRRILRDGGVLMIKTCTEDDLRARWVENFFPSALPFNMRRYPVIEKLEAEFVAEGFALRSIIRSRTLPVISTSSLLVSVKARHNTTLASLSSAEFEDGYERLRQCLSEKDAVVVPQAHTHIVVTNDSSNEVRTSADVLGSAETRSQRRVAADVAVIRGRETLLVKRAFPPDAGDPWWLRRTGRVSGSGRGARAVGGNSADPDVVRTCRRPQRARATSRPAHNGLVRRRRQRRRACRRRCARGAVVPARQASGVHGARPQDGNREGGCSCGFAATGAIRPGNGGGPPKLATRARGLFVARTRCRRQAFGLL